MFKKGENNIEIMTNFIWLMKKFNHWLKLRKLGLTQDTKHSMTSSSIQLNGPVTLKERDGKPNHTISN